jgi:hypothetical protein
MATFTTWPASVTSWDLCRTRSPLGLLSIAPGWPGGTPPPSSGVVGLLEPREVGHGPDAAQVDLEQLAEAAGRRVGELLAGLGAAPRVADQQIPGPTGEAEVDRAGGGDAARLGDRRQAGEHPVLGPLGDPGHGAGTAEAALAAPRPGHAIAAFWVVRGP